MDFDHIHFYVADAAAQSRWFIEQFGFQAIAPLLPTAPYWLQQGAVTIACSSPPAPLATAYLRQQPPGVVDVALRVRQLEPVLAQAIAAGATVLHPLQAELSPPCRWATIAGLGNLRHTLVERSPTERGAITQHGAGVALEAIDHVVLNVPAGELATSVAWYQRVLGFQPTQTFQIETPHSGLRSQVLQHPHGTAQIPINEPTSARSQIQDFLDRNQGPGVQHVAFQTAQIVAAVAHLRQQGLRFLPVPATYYDHLAQRRGDRLAHLDWAAIMAQQILVDWTAIAPEVPLLQIFTEPILAQPTFFLELIQRQCPLTATSTDQATGFGEGNFQALFEAMEREQAQRSRC